ncbi:MAG: hypothetical protein NVS3B17_05070 [Vulcanimicrobiaceae bacterium]
MTGLERDTRRLVRSSFAALVCASGAVMTSAALVVRTERSPVLAAVNGGLALASAAFAVATATHALANRSLPTPVVAPPDEMRESLERISRIAQAGALGDANAAQHAFAMIARRTRESLELLAD